MNAPSTSQQSKFDWSEATEQAQKEL